MGSRRTRPRPVAAPPEGRAADGSDALLRERRGERARGFRRGTGRVSDLVRVPYQDRASDDRIDRAWARAAFAADPVARRPRGARELAAAAAPAAAPRTRDL